MICRKHNSPHKLKIEELIYYVGKTLIVFLSTIWMYIYVSSEVFKHMSQGVFTLGRKTILWFSNIISRHKKALSQKQNQSFSMLKIIHPSPVTIFHVQNAHIPFWFTINFYVITKKHLRIKPFFYLASCI